MDRGLSPLIRRWLVLLGVAAVAASAVGYLVASRITLSYEARTRLLVGPMNTDYDTLRASSVLTRTYAELATSEQIIKKAAPTLAPAIRAPELRRSLAANANDVTRILTIRATGSDAALAARSVQVVAEELVRLTSGTPDAPAPPAGTVTIIDAAEIPEHPVAPKTKVLVMLSMLAGVLAALAIAVVIEALQGPHHPGAKVQANGLGAAEWVVNNLNRHSVPAGFGSNGRSEG